MTDSGATEPRTDRFRPTRCGVVNLWDYRDDEFVFADGRLVLRGPNGSGKTKALEVLFPFVLDGRIEPRRLNPFAGDERTMKANLLYRGQEAAYGYVWMEFRRAGNPAGEVVTIGAGLRAQRHHERVSRWYFVVDGQVGVDFSLIGEDDRPLTKRQLEAEVDHLPATMAERPLAHRTAVDARLFGLGIGRYEQMLTLLLTLRRPQLAKNLDPKGLSRALADGLRPLDEHLVDEAAHSFSDMENVQRTLSGLVQADAAAAAFLVGYTTYLRTHARAEADRLTVRLEAIDAARVSLTAALAAETGPPPPATPRSSTSLRPGIGCKKQRPGWTRSRLHRPTATASSSTGSRTPRPTWAGRPTGTPRPAIRPRPTRRSENGPEPARQPPTKTRYPQSAGEPRSCPRPPGTPASTGTPTTRSMTSTWTSGWPRASRPERTTSRPSGSRWPAWPKRLANATWPNAALTGPRSGWRPSNPP